MLQLIIDMDNETLDVVDLERHIYSVFNYDVKIQTVVSDIIPVSRSAEAIVFMTDKHQLYCYIDSAIKLTLGDVKKIVKRMGLVPIDFLPPRGDAEYFDEIAREKYNKMFPGMRQVSSDDLNFYRTMAPYCPALVQIGEVVSGIIKQYDSTAVGGWRPTVKFAYKKLLTD